MFSRQRIASDTAQELRAEIGRWPPVPDEALRFHKVRLELEQEIDRLGGRSWPPWSRRTEQADAARTLAGQLAEAARSLGMLFTTAHAQRERIVTLRQRRHRLDGSPLTDWIERRCGAWEQELERFGADLLRPAEIDNARRQLDERADELDLHERAVGGLIDARRTLRKLAEEGQELEAAPLSATLPELESRLEELGPSHEWLRELESVVEPARRAADKGPPPKPAELNEIGRLLGELRNWLTALGQDPREPGPWRELQASLRSNEQRWRRGEETGDAAELLEQTQHLLHELIEESRTVRAEQLDHLRNQLKDLRQVVVSVGPDLEHKIEALERERPSTLWRDHGRWMEEAAKARQTFVSEAENHVHELAESWESRREELDHGLERQLATPLSNELRISLFRVRDELREITPDPERRDVEEILTALRQGGELQERLRELARLAHEENVEIHRHRERLEERCRALRALEEQRVEARSGPVPELPDQMPASLEETQTLLARYEEELGRRELHLLREITESLTDLDEETDRLRTLLDHGTLGLPEESRTSAPPDPEVEPKPLAETSESALASLLADPALAPELADAVERLLASERRHGALRDRLVRTTETLEERARSLLHRLEQLDTDRLRPTDRELVAGLLGRFEKTLDDGPGTAVVPVDARDLPGIEERVPELVELILDTTELLAELFAQQDRVETLEDDLGLRLRALRSRGFAPHCPEPLLRRVEILVEGVPEAPIDWTRAEHQLGEADALLGRLERHAHRIEAEQLRADIARLGERQRDRPDPRIERLLTEITESGHRDLPPASVRRKVETWARRRRPTASERSSR